MAADYAQLVADLRAESLELSLLLDGLAPDEWSRDTPSVGWSIKDQINHLAYFDDAARIAIQNPVEFEVTARRLLKGPPDFPHELVKKHRSLSRRSSLSWLKSARTAFLEVATECDPAARLPWFGVTMSAGSLVTARIMETWAHGQDISDALGVHRVPTARLRHICHLGYSTRGFSYRSLGQQPPTSDVHVTLIAPDGTSWSWGLESAPQSIAGSALDFSLVVTQRRHVRDTDLEIVGVDAIEWMELRRPSQVSAEEVARQIIQLQTRHREIAEPYGESSFCGINHLLLSKRVERLTRL